MAALCGALKDCTADERKKLIERFSKRRPYAVMRRSRLAGTGEADRRSCELEGIGFIKENRRYYPNRELAAHVLGYTGVDNDGLAGIEVHLRQADQGEAGTIFVQTDARRRAFGRIEQAVDDGAIARTDDRRVPAARGRARAAGRRP